MDPNDLLAQILASQGSRINPGAMAATRQGVSRTDLSALLNPSLMAGLGLNDPYRIAEGLDPAFEKRQQQAIREYQDEQNKILASVVRPPALDLGKVLRKYEGEKYQDVVGDVAFLSGMIEAGYDAVDAEDELIKRISDKKYENYNPRLEKYYLQLSGDLKRFEEERQTIDKANLKYQEDLTRAQQQLDILRQPEFPEYDQFRRSYYEEQGVPGLANLPDPRQQYQFGDMDVRGLLGQEQETKYERALQGLMQNFQTRNTQEIGPPMPVSSSDPANLIEGFGERDINALISANRTATQQREVVARRLQQNLLAQGRTPFEDSMQGLLGYAVTEAAPRPSAQKPRPLNPRITI